jgi:hypothetical protein
MTDTAQPRRREAHIFERDEHDHYVEPLAVGEALFDYLALPSGTIVLDPACGWGRIVRAAMGARCIALGSDIVERWGSGPDGAFSPRAGEWMPSFRDEDFFAPKNAIHSQIWERPDVIASNPPFDRSEEFLDVALTRARSMVALILPDRWLWGKSRARRLRGTPFYKWLPICPRPSMPPGAAILAGQKVGGDTKNYAVGVWLHGYRGPVACDWLFTGEMRDGDAVG